MKCEVAVVGAGIAGLAVAHELTHRRGVRDVVVFDPLPPLSLTSDKSTECYRNWWPDAPMRAFMDRSIDHLEQLARETDNLIHLNRRGYLYATGDPEAAEAMRRDAESYGEVREGSYQRAEPWGYDSPITGADWLKGAALREAFPAVTERAIAALHVRRAGWLSAQQLGMTLLDRFRERGGSLVRQRVTAASEGRLELESGEVVDAQAVVFCPGPLLGSVWTMLGIDGPAIKNELHRKISLADTVGGVPRDAPLMIWNDPVELPWSDDERAWLASERPEMLQPFASGVHCRPDGPISGQTLLILWTYDVEPVTPVWPIPLDDDLPEIAVRGMSVMIPGLARLVGAMSRPFQDGGYYAKTADNRPLIGPIAPGAYVLGALSGYGIMASLAGAELVADDLLGATLPDYAAHFSPSRPIDERGASLSGQL